MGLFSSLAAALSCAWLVLGGLAVLFVWCALVLKKRQDKEDYRRRKREENARRKGPVI